MDNVKLEINQGTDFSADITLSNDDGTPVNLTGKTLLSQVKEDFCGDEVFAFTLTAKDQGTNPGEFTMSAAKFLVDTCIKSKKSYVYDVLLVDDSSDDVSKLFGGPLIVIPKVTTVAP